MEVVERMIVAVRLAIGVGSVVLTAGVVSASVDVSQYKLPSLRSNCSIVC